MAKHNAAIYGVDNIDWVLADVPTWLRQYAKAVGAGSAPPVEVVFMSPAWGGPGYSTSASFALADLKPLPAADLVLLARELTDNVALFLPRNLDLHDRPSRRCNGTADGLSVAALQTSPEAAIELEENWMGVKLKAVTVYLGDLVV